MSISAPWPEHRNPNREESASTPYNFVPLPEMIIPAVDDVHELPDHDCYDRERLSGYFDVMLTTRSPLYIRSAINTSRQEQNSQGKDRPEFFYTRNEHIPVIPGSSLRGMLRGLLEIASYGKMQWVSEKQLFFRTVDNSAVGTYYNHRMVEEVGIVQQGGHPQAPGYRTRVKGGFFRVRHNGTCFIEECTVARIEIQDLQQLFGLTDSHALYQLNGRNVDEKTARNPNQTPKWLYQHREIWADIDGKENDYFFPKQFTTDRNNRRRMRHPDLYLRFQRARNLIATQVAGKRSGKLVLTGPMTSKHLAFLFAPLKQPATLEVPNDPSEQDHNKRLVDRFHDDDQLTQWQIKAFPANRSSTGQQEAADGRLRDGDPVFFLQDTGGSLVFFGRAQMFRLPYKQRPIDLVPYKLRQATDIDYAEAMFGFVRTDQQLAELGTRAPRQGDRGRAYASRVIVSDGILQSNPADIWLAGGFDTEIIPKILATPKPTAFQHYLTQQHSGNKRELDHYDSTLQDSYKTIMRGHKLYWHQGLGTDHGHTLEQIRNVIKEPAPVPLSDTQHTRFKPLKPGVVFSFRVHFENLSDRELGALCWTLHPHGEPDRRYCHHLGMGKPLGMGAVELRARLHIIDRPLRYKTLFTKSSDYWQLGTSPTQENSSRGTSPTSEADMGVRGEDLAIPEVLARLTKPFEDHLLSKLNPDPPCTRLADMRRIAMLLKLLEWPGYHAEEEGGTYLKDQNRPNTRYMKIQPNEYYNRPVLPDPTLFDESYFQGKSRPQGSQESTIQAAAERDRQQTVLSPELAAIFSIGRDLRNLVLYTKNERGIEVRFWNLAPEQVIGFIPNELIDRNLGSQISGIVTGLHQEPTGRLVVELKLRPRRS